VLLIPPPAGMPDAAWSVTALAALMIVWWVTEALPISATALLPLVALPLLGIVPLRQAAAPYADPLIFLFLGGFLIAAGIERVNLHRRIALVVLGVFGTAPHRLIAGFMCATAFLSMWLSNTATVLLMLPMATSVLDLLDAPRETKPAAGRDDRIAKALLLGIAYAASIGGLGTLIGTPPNALLAAFLSERYGIQLGFARWMLFGVPLALVLLALAWLLLTRAVLRVERGEMEGAREIFARERAALGPMRGEERMVATVLLAVAALWLARPAIDAAFPGNGLSDAAIAVLGGLVMFVIPLAGRGAGPVLAGDWAKRLPWDVLVLFGGGLSLAEAIQASGLAAWIADAMAGFGGMHPFLLVLAVTALVVFLTEVASNTATAALFVPIAAALGVAATGDPMLLSVPVALAASCGFMLPMGTPPNALVYASGRLRMADMAKAGILLNLVGIAAIATYCYAVT
jgi:sodium-dependent dicarboxylate transporter 2/3/5